VLNASGLAVTNTLLSGHHPTATLLLHLDPLLLSLAGSCFLRLSLLVFFALNLFVSALLGFAGQAA
jgi:hypothetical protein